MSQNTQVDVFVSFHGVVAHLLLDVLHRDTGLSCFEGKVCFFVRGGTSGTGFRVYVGFEFGVPDGVMSVNGDLFFLETVFEVDQELLAVIFAEQNINFVSFRDLNVVI